MSMPVSSDAENALLCPFCGRELDLLVVNPAGELIGCEDCAAERRLAGEVLTIDEWNSPAALAEVLAHYDLPNWQARKPAPTPTQLPRAHYWEVLSGNSHYFLKRFPNWYPPESIRYTHSVMQRLVQHNLPAPQWVPDTAGMTYTEGAGSYWALYHALDGRVASQQDWMWGRPKAAEMLALIHLALEGFTPEGEEFKPWGAWTLDTVDRVLESWHPHPDLPPDLLAHVRDRLAARYFGDLYPQLPNLVVHGDYVASNLLWRGDTLNASVSGVLDFEKAHLDTALFDFAWGLGDRRPPLLRATIAKYSHVRPLSAIEREAMPEALLLGALMGIDIQMTYFNNMDEVSRLAIDLSLMVRDLESLRKAAALK